MKRRKALDNLFDNLGNKAALISLSHTIDATPADLVRVVKEVGFEGIVAKRRDSIYEYGKRSGAWVKHRINKGQEFVIGGYVPVTRSTLLLSAVTTTGSCSSLQRFETVLCPALGARWPADLPA